MLFTSRWGGSTRAPGAPGGPGVPGLPVLPKGSVVASLFVRPITLFVLGQRVSISFAPHSYASRDDLHSQNLLRTDSRAPESHTTHFWSIVALILSLHSFTATDRCQIAHNKPPSFLTLS